MGKIPLKWILVGVLILLVGGYLSVQGPGVQCNGSMVYCPGVGCVSGPDKCNAGYSGGPSAVFSKTWEHEQFTDGKDVYPEMPKFVEVSPRSMAPCDNGTRAPDGRCSRYLGP
jgi:hypothetical protein